MIHSPEVTNTAFLFCENKFVRTVIVFKHRLIGYIYLLFSYKLFIKHSLLHSQNRKHTVIL